MSLLLFLPLSLSLSLSLSYPCLSLFLPPLSFNLSKPGLSSYLYLSLSRYCLSFHHFFLSVCLSLSFSLSRYHPCLSSYLSLSYPESPLFFLSPTPVSLSHSCILTLSLSLSYPCLSLSPSPIFLSLSNLVSLPIFLSPATTYYPN